MVDASVSSGLSLEEKALALRAILESDTFARSERLKCLLRFICEAEMEGRGVGLTEYSIGTEALGRPKDFAPLEDSTVRSRVHELKQKLEKYYSQEAPLSTVRINLRKGSYVPRFSAVYQEQETSIAVVTEAPPLPLNTVAAAELLPVPAPKSRNNVWQICAAAFAAGCLAMFGALAIGSAFAHPGVRIPGTRFEKTAVPSLWTPELDTLWRPFLQKGTPLLIAFETRFFVKMGPLVVRDWNIDNLGDVENSAPLMQLQKLFGLHQLYPSGNYTDVGAPGALFYLTRLLASRAPSLSVKPVGDLTAVDLKDSNIIFIGKQGGDAQIRRVLAHADLIDMNGKVLVKHPGPGERAEYVDQGENSWSEKYSIVSIVPGPGKDKRILALTASGSEHPSALAYYLTQPDTVLNLVKHLKGSSGRMPDYFQILLRSEFKGKSLVRAEYVTHRIL